MATKPLINGMLLEEATLYLLEASGYRTVTSKGNDPTLNIGSAGMEVYGRSGSHQIDAIADFVVCPPFSHQQRLLVEAKCYSSRVKLLVVRNAVGVLKDVSEYWVIPSPSMNRFGSNSSGSNRNYANQALPKSRYHYQYAVISASGYTSRAEEYAFTQDIFLIQVANSQYFQPVLEAIRKVQDLSSIIASSPQHGKITLTELRNSIRDNIRNPQKTLSPVISGSSLESLENFCQACRDIRIAVLIMIDGQFPMFLIPHHDHDYRWILELNDKEVRLSWDKGRWYLQSDGERLFSFDVPLRLFELYAEQGFLSDRNSTDRRSREYLEIQAFAVLNERRLSGGEDTIDSRFRVLTFKLIGNLLGQIRQILSSI